MRMFRREIQAWAKEGLKLFIGKYESKPKESEGIKKG